LISRITCIIVENIFYKIEYKGRMDTMAFSVGSGEVVMEVFFGKLKFGVQPVEGLEV
jgi:hypothetical protein